jgi:hypothetical protein
VMNARAVRALGLPTKSRGENGGWGRTRPQIGAAAFEAARAVAKRRRERRAELRRHPTRADWSPTWPLPQRTIAAGFLLRIHPKSTLALELKRFRGRFGSALARETQKIRLPKPRNRGLIWMINANWNDNANPKTH